MNRMIIVMICIIAISKQSAWSQVCQGSTGQPSYVYNFTGGKFAGYTDFDATASKPFLGAYTFVSVTTTLDSSWRLERATLENRIAIFNVPPTPRIIYSDTFKTLCAATTYSLRLLGATLEKNSEQTLLSFSARTNQGVTTFDCYTSLVGFAAGEYGITFTTPASGGDVIITVLASAARGDHSWFGLGGIVLANCGPPMRAIGDYNANSQNTISVCEGDNKTFHLSLQMPVEYPDPFYQWQKFDNAARQWINIDDATTKEYTYDVVNAVAGRYLFRVNSGPNRYKNSPTCTSNSTELTLNVSKNPVAVATLGSAGCVGETIILHGSGGSKYYWTGPNGFTYAEQDPEIKNAVQANSGIYQLTVSQNDCSSTTAINVLVNAKPTISAGADRVICKGDHVALSASGGVIYEWVPAAGLSDTHIANPVASPLITTTYKVIGFNAAGCKSEAVITITVTPQPTADAGRDKQVYKNEPIRLIGKVDHSSAFYWTPADFLNDPHSLIPIATPEHDMIYTLHALPLTGCITEITDEVFIKAVDKVIIPNVFTPNGDGTNDAWVIKGLDTYTGALVQIFNRYGAQLYQSISYSPWDGKLGAKPLPAGTYYYRIDLKNGSVLSGPITIIR